ncbi:lytic transglycosylase domain-containing protein [Subtercola sp. RTI3]|uniref:aggregation-promoting factor C-terminal-like domain-containing protein n=1 Tax=Subtercola sp. RTI3 TaxID=3048639 RepID=UPI002B23C368|nr:lytic transglycosylase domain-containing protein [Subtercola sp. RTI3]MEA9985873.1 lytic transglycosylase domain-containing protein [Subtercola sp. RTI3]
MIAALGLAGTVALPLANAASLDSVPVQKSMAEGQVFAGTPAGAIVAQRDEYTATDPAVIIAQRAAAAAAAAAAAKAAEAAKTAAQAAASAAASNSSSSSSSSSSYTVPAAAVPDPGSAQAIGLAQVTARGWGSDQYSCLVSLWNRESGWRVNAYNAGSGAQGIPQALPGSKMASAGADWATNPATQITWGLNYISGVYGTPCGAWAHSENSGWY